MFNSVFAAHLIFGVSADEINLQQVITAILLAVFISITSLKFKFLKSSGAAAVFFMALLIFSFGGWKWTIPMVTFFLLSSLISKIKKHDDEISEKTGSRDFSQVFANGGFASILIILNFFFFSELFYVAYVSSIASVCADTWETEIGTFVKGRTINILNLKAIQPGLSGGVSAAGTIGGVFGAFTIALSSIYWINQNHLLFIFIVLAAGLAGSIFDSIAGAAFQRKNRCELCGINTEKVNHCGSPTLTISGIKWLNNDAVNFAAASFGGIFAMLITELLKP